MKITDLVKEAHDNAVAKGFYDCPECAGEGKWIIDNPRTGNMAWYQLCQHCHGTGKVKKNVGELLMLIVSELGEALEAHRCGRKADWQNYTWQIEKSGLDSIKSFELNVKDTFEDEIADTFIRLADMCGYMNIDIEKHIRAKLEYNKTRPYRHGKNY